MFRSDGIKGVRTLSLKFDAIIGHPGWGDGWLFSLSMREDASYTYVEVKNYSRSKVLNTKLEVYQFSSLCRRQSTCLNSPSSLLLGSHYLFGRVKHFDRCYRKRYGLECICFSEGIS